jgi:signal transduction histidine kinase
MVTTLKKITGASQLRSQWPILLLGAAVLLPTAVVLWLIDDAIANQRSVVHEGLMAAYESHLSLVRQGLEDEWSHRARALDATAGDAAGFAAIVKYHRADSAIILNAAGVPAYPASPRTTILNFAPAPPAFLRAQQLESNDLPAAAANLYIAVGEAAKDRSTAARAFQAAARCLVQAGQKERAAAFIMEHFEHSELERATDPQGRAIAPDALLMAIQLLKPGDPRRVATAQRLHELLLDYNNPAIISAQRIFIMKEMRAQKLPPQVVEFSTLDAEELAMRVLEAEPKPRSDPATFRLTAAPGIWVLASSPASSPASGREGSTSPGRVLGLFRTETILAETRAFLSRQDLPAAIQMDVVPPGGSVNSKTLIKTEPASDRLPGWQLVLVSTGTDPFKEMASQRLTHYLWLGFGVTSAVVLLALIAARLINQRLRLAGMKADLVAVVSHELKTPISSMGLLVDTLLDEAALDPDKTREYLELIARENARLSLLIENFLTFSRIERNKYSFQFAPVNVEDLVDATVKAAGQRFSEPGCQLQVEVTPDLPEIRADEGALITALVNLLDNAYKYTLSDKHITLRAFAQNGDVCFEVRDNGIGIPQREIQRIFQKFYQADRRLSRSGGGCGLGLSIVHFLVEAHGGNVRVASEPGKGSTFTVALEVMS